MDKKPLNDENEFYRGYEETTQTYLNENEKVEFVPKHDFGALKKKSFIVCNMGLKPSPLGETFRLTCL